MNIKTWKERKAESNQQWPDDGCMKDEISELRAALAARDEELQRTYECIRSHARITFTAEEKVQEQRKVLEQALEALQRNVQHKYPLEPKEAVNLGQAAIAAIQEISK